LAAELVRARLLLWATAFLAAVATGLVVPASPGLGFLAGPAIGIALFVILARDRPHVPERPVAVVAARGAYLFAGAAFEELLWRGLGLVLLADLTGPLVALALTSGAFALWHRRSCGRQSAVHVLTGLAFGGAFFVGGLVAAILAHASYNVLVDLSVQAKRAWERGP
jgi:membrane protease YdiL (CAAX protease family)